MENKKDLVEEIASRMRCAYVSDLHDPTRYLLVLSAIFQIEKGRYSAREWCDAYCYVTGRKIPGDRGNITEEEIRELFASPD